jgi:hypothetical protein
VIFFSLHIPSGRFLFPPEATLFSVLIPPGMECAPVPVTQYLLAVERQVIPPLRLLNIVSTRRTKAKKKLSHEKEHIGQERISEASEKNYFHV